MQGALDKKMKSRMRGFKSRWFMLRPKELVYYESEAAAQKNPEAPLGIIPLAVRGAPKPAHARAFSGQPAALSPRGPRAPPPPPPSKPPCLTPTRAATDPRTRNPRRTVSWRSRMGLPPPRTPSGFHSKMPP